jgi:hypothetical protein
MYIHTQLHTCNHAYINTHTNTHTHTYTHIHIHTHLLHLLHKLVVAQVPQAARATLVVAFALWGGATAGLELLMKHLAVTWQMCPGKPLLSLDFVRAQMRS